MYQSVTQTLKKLLFPYISAASLAVLEQTWLSLRQALQGLCSFNSGVYRKKRKPILQASITCDGAYGTVDMKVDSHVQ